MLSQNETLFYLRKAKLGDEKAKEELYEKNTPLIKSIVKKFLNKGVEYGDLYQIACMGFLKALNNFDESFNVKFSTYVVPMIVGEIKRYMRDNGAIKVSRAIKILANKINKYVSEYQTIHNSSPTIKELSEVFKVEEDDILFALDSSKMPISLYDNNSDDENLELIEKIPSEYSEESLIEKIQLSALIDKLTDREKKIIAVRYFRDKTQSETAKMLGVSQVQVSRIESKILLKIKSEFN